MGNADLKKALRKWIKILGLEDWEISIRWVEVAGGDENAAAAVVRNNEAKTAEIGVSHGAMGDTDLIDACVCHECVHVALGPLSGAIEQVCEDAIDHDRTRKLATSVLESAEESVVCGLERALVDHCG